MTISQSDKIWKQGNFENPNFDELRKIEKRPAAATLKNPNYRSLRELEKTWKYSLRLRFQSLNFESIDNWEKLCLNLSFTVENKMGNFHKAGHISNLTWWMRYSISSNLKNLSRNWEKCVLNWII